MSHLPGTRPGVLHEVAYQGDSYARTLSILTEDDTPMDLTGMDVELALAVVRNGRPAFTYLGTVTDPVNGKAAFYIPDDETVLWNAGRYYRDITVRDGLGYTQTLVTGRLEVQRRAKP